MPNFAALTAIRAGDADLPRLTDLVDSLLSFEPSMQEMVVVDDSVEPRDLSPIAQLPSICKLTVIPNPRKGQGNGLWGGVTVGLLTAYAHLAKTNAEFVLRLDTDALVIGPFAQKIAAAFSGDPSAGILGSYEVDCNGKPRDFSTWVPLVQRLAAPFKLFGANARRHPLALVGRRARIRRELLMARDNGYQFGKHCMGGAYALSGAVIKAMAAKGLLDDPLRWLQHNLSEDVLVSAYVFAAGFVPKSFVARDETFGVVHRGLPDKPQALIDRGYGVIHSIKDQPELTEQQIRDFYRQKRQAP